MTGLRGRRPSSGRRDPDKSETSLSSEILPEKFIHVLERQHRGVDAKLGAKTSFEHVHQSMRIRRKILRQILLDQQGTASPEPMPELQFGAIERTALPQ